MQMGRNFLEEEEQPGKEHVAILTHGTWQRHFGAMPGIVGAHIALNDISYTVVGVLPRDFEFVGKASDFHARNQFDVWVPLVARNPQRGTHPLRGLCPAQTWDYFDPGASRLDFNSGQSAAPVP
jgi:hypothetical protein